MGLTPRIGLYGGAFDPPHDAHLALARAAIRQLGLQRLHVVPTGDAWHKSRTLTPARDRMAMCELAFAVIPEALVDPREVARDGPSYTIDTLSELRNEHPEAELFLVIGADQAQWFHNWHRARHLLALAHIAVAARAGEHDWDPADPLPGLAPAAGRVVQLDLPPMPHRASTIRSRVASGLPIQGMVPAAVARYIATHDLYRSAA